MEYKKNPRVDIHRWSSLIFQLSLITVLSLVIMAFEWSSASPMPPIDLTSSRAGFQLPPLPDESEIPPDPLLPTEQNPNLEDIPIQIHLDI